MLRISTTADLLNFVSLLSTAEKRDHIDSKDLKESKTPNSIKLDKLQGLIHSDASEFEELVNQDPDNFLKRIDYSDWKAIDLFDDEPLSNPHIIYLLAMYNRKDLLSLFLKSNIDSIIWLNAARVAATYGNTAVVDYLLKNKLVEINPKEDEMTLLQYAVVSLNLNCVKSVWEYKERNFPMDYLDNKGHIICERLARRIRDFKLPCDTSSKSIFQDRIGEVTAYLIHKGAGMQIDQELPKFLLDFLDLSKSVEEAKQPSSRAFR